MTKDYIEVKKEDINFKGDTESEKKANEVIYDLTLEIDRLQHRIAELSKINEEHRKLNGELRQWDKNKDTRNSRQRVANAELVKRNKELKEDIKGYEQERQVLLDDLNKITEAKKKIKEKLKKNQFENTYTNIVHNAFQIEKKEKRYYANILTEFEKWLKEEINNRKTFYTDPLGKIPEAIIDTLKFCLDKLQELKEGNK